MISKKTFALLVLAAVATALTGCSTKSQKQSSIPWNQPASWEGQIPGMSQPMGR